jgi:hypothetical protein
MPKPKKKRVKLTPAQQKKFEKVMHEFGKGTLRRSSGETVKSKDEALAIAFSEARKIHG